MKFIRKVKVRDRFIDILSKALLIGISVLACLWMVSGAHAAQISITGIKTVPQEDGSYNIDFALSQKLRTEDVAVAFERNFIQISLRGVSAYPPRTEKFANQMLLEKVFTYQYQPDLARARVLLKTTAAKIKSKASWAVTDEGLRITVKGAASGGEVAAAAAPLDAVAPDKDEERIVQEILNEKNLLETKTDAKAIPPAAAGEEQPIFGAKAGVSEPGKPKESPWTKIFASLLLVIGIIGATAAAFRRFVLGRGLVFRRQTKVIDVVANQAIGPKRSVALIKVLDQYMVIGMAGDGMSLLANLGSDVKIEKFLDQGDIPGSSFSDAFEGALNTGSAKTDTAGLPIAHKVSVDHGIRSAIKKRIEGFKPL